MIGQYFAKLDAERARAARRKRPVRWFRMYVTGVKTEITLYKIRLS